MLAPFSQKISAVSSNVMPHRVKSEKGIIGQITGAAVWSYAAIFADRAIRFAAFVVVARLLPSGQFGVVLLSLLIVETLQAFLDCGVSTVLIQQQNLTKQQIDTAFFITMTMSGLSSLVLMLAAPLLSKWAGNDTSVLFLRTLAIVPLISGAGAIQVALIQREIGFKALAGRTVFSSIAASVVAILLAWRGFGAWALVGRTFLSVISGTAIAWLATNYRPSLHFDLNSARVIVPAGLRLWAAGIANQINSRGLDFFAGAFLGVVALGALRIAGQTVMLLMEITIGPMSAVGYAVLSRARHDLKLFEETLITFANIVALLIFPAFAGLLVTADLILPLMFGDRWQPAAAIVPFMCAVAPAIYWHLLVSTALFASGRNDRILQWAVVEAGLTGIVGLVGARYGLVGVAAAGVLRLYLMIPIGWRWLNRDVGVNPRSLVIASLPSIGASVVMAIMVELAKLNIPTSFTPLTATLTLVFIGIVVFSILLPFSARSLIQHLPSWQSHGTFGGLRRLISRSVAQFRRHQIAEPTS